MRYVRWLTALLAAGPLAACSGYLGSARGFDPADLAREPGWLAIKDVPVIRQEEEKDCGAAAFMMVSTFWGIPATLDEIRTACGCDEHGIKAGRLRDYALQKGL